MSAAAPENCGHNVLRREIVTPDVFLYRCEQCGAKFSGRLEPFAIQVRYPKDDRKEESKP
jgi:DNA-directed RNA polymerase subunit RPC12/RpoP